MTFLSLTNRCFWEEQKCVERDNVQDFDIHRQKGECIEKGKTTKKCRRCLGVPAFSRMFGSYYELHNRITGLVIISERAFRNLNVQNWFGRDRHQW